MQRVSSRPTSARQTVLTTPHTPPCDCQASYSHHKQERKATQHRLDQVKKLQLQKIPAIQHQLDQATKQRDLAIAGREWVEAGFLSEEVTRLDKQLQELIRSMLHVDHNLKMAKARGEMLKGGAG